MRSHQQIVQDHGASKLRRDLAGIGLQLSLTAAQRWADRNSIPGEYWPAVAHVTGVTVAELAESAEASKLPAAAVARRAATAEQSAQDKAA